METRTCLNSFLFVLLSMSVLATGCSRQFHTALASSDDGFNRQLASLFSSPSMNEGLLTEDRPQAGKGSSSLVAGVPVDSAEDEAVISGLDNQQFQPDLHTGLKSGDGISIHDSLSPSPDGITPLNPQDLLTEMAAASASGELSGSSLESNSTNGSALTLLGDELFGQGNLGDVFFDFDAATIRSDAVSVLHKNAQILKARVENHQVVIEGHADERGTVEYNLVLGERRARSSKQYLVDLGVSPSIIQTISYGKEKPFCHASKPDCWKMNRRGHFVLE